MTNVYDTVELRWSEDGDYILDSDGDLRDTLPDQIQWLTDAIHTEMTNERGDWDLEPSIGANLLDFIGEPNTRVTGEKIKQRIISVLTRPELISTADLTVEVAPVSIHAIAIVLIIRVASTPNNSVVADVLILNYLYDYSENAILPIAPGREGADGLYSSHGIQDVTNVDGSRPPLIV